jgi:hypothetical protein
MIKQVAIEAAARAMYELDRTRNFSWPEWAALSRNPSENSPFFEWIQRARVGLEVALIYQKFQ